MTANFQAGVAIDWMMSLEATRLNRRIVWGSGGGGGKIGKFMKQKKTKSTLLADNPRGLVDNNKANKAQAREWGIRKNNESM